ncbi:hypothetical protein BBJ29_000286 [Phytophthora kernoviae]|uniref:TATA-box-binding protein n=1 Tax=Phytophthora kernoviae TaxID=325452 RepID=A0A3F2S050_9STRA|nr:hypothetical protein BBJ29_000286 [Phytophthora kernoviae]RLN67707.1 hypothetical protein BBP00_00001452 [Phytophthora kernoviae]
MDDSNGSEWTPARLAEEGVAYRVVNVLGSGCIREPLDVKKLALMVRNADYAPRNFNALVMRFQDPRATVLVYRSGKFVVLGATSVGDARLAADKLISILKKVSFPSKHTPLSIRNVVGSTEVCFKVRLEGLARHHSRFCTYEPELFPGLIYRMLHPKCTLLIFISGKLVITGCKSPADGEKALCKIYPVLLLFRLREDSSDEEDDDEDESMDVWI